MCHVIKLSVRCSDLSSLTVRVQLGAAWLTCVFSTVQRRSGAMASGGCRWAQRGTPYSGWRRALHTPRTGGTHLGLMEWLSWLSAHTRGVQLDSEQDVWMNLNAQNIERSVEFAVSCPVTAQPAVWILYGQSFSALWIFNWTPNWWIQRWNLGKLELSEYRGVEARKWTVANIIPSDFILTWCWKQIKWARALLLVGRCTTLGLWTRVL